MRKMLLVFITLITLNICAFSQVENVAKEILEAYKNKNVELLKKNASGILLMAISADYFNDPALKGDLKSVEKWNGEIKEIRYQTGDMMGKKIFLATAYYVEISGTNEIYTVSLSSIDGQKWVMFGSGLAKIQKAEFEQMSKEIQFTDAKKETKPARIYSIDMANDDSFDKVTQEKMVECINKLDDEIFFITLNCNDDFIQAAYSEKGYAVEYSEKGVRYVATEVLSKEQTIILFKKYFQNMDDWKQGINWKQD